MKKIILVLFIFLSCRNDKVEQRTFIVDGSTYKCKTYINSNEVYKEVCFYQNEDTLSFINFKNSKRSGLYKEYYKDNVLKRLGTYKDGFKIGIWKEYFENGKIKFNLIYVEDSDSTKLVYKKEYYENGNLKSCNFPIELTTNSEDNVYRVNETYQLHIKLKYSIYDKCKISGGLLGNQNNQILKLWKSKDPLLLICEFTPLKTGDYIIEGDLLEYDGINKNDYSGINYFEFKYKAVK